MNIDYFRAAEREISSLPLLKKSLPIMRKRLERLIEAGAPKEPAGVDFSKPYVDSHHVNDTLGELCALVETKNEIYATEQKIREIEEKRGELDYLIDGAVVKIRDFSTREALGSTEKFPRWAVAFKFEAEEVTSLLEDVTWEIGRSGI